MREKANRRKVEDFMRAIGSKARSECRVYFTGGATAVLLGWRDTTIDLDVKFDPELDELYRALPEIKERYQINVELASPPDFIPPLPGWQERSLYIGREGKVSFFNYDLYSQALAKIEREHQQDTHDVRAMLRDGLVEPEKLIALFKAVEPNLYKYPAIDPRSFERQVQKVVAQP